MADLYGNGYKKVYVNVPAEKYGEGQFSARVRVFTDTFELSGAVSQNDIIHLFKLTPQVRILGGTVKSDDMGANGAFKLGVVGDDDCLVASMDASTGSGAASLFDVKGSAVLDKLTVEQEVVLTCTESTAATSGKITVTLLVAEA